MKEDNLVRSLKAEETVQKLDTYFKIKGYHDRSRWISDEEQTEDFP